VTAELVRATLQRLGRVQQGKKDAPSTVRPEGDAISVQLNPSSLKITRRNNVDRGGVTTGTQKAQHPSQEGATLAFDLEFDTSEQGSGGEHVDVREWTALVRQYVEPPKKKPGEAPPAVRFTWGRLIFNGIVEQVTEDLDMFAPDGTALHAKVSLSIAEQDFAFENMESGNGKRDQRAATEPGAPTGAAPGQNGTRNPTNVVPAHDGENVQQLLSRLGQDPSGWRAAMSGLDSPLDLAAGAAVTLGSEITAGLTGAVGSAAGQFAARATVATPAALATALGVPEPTGRADRAPAGGAVGRLGPDSPDDGFALSAAGGLAAAELIVDRASVRSALDRSTGSFAVPGSAGRSAVEGGAVDPRALTYGQRVPLQGRAQPATAEQAGPNAPPWERLPARGCDPATAEQRRRDGRPPTIRWRPGGATR
jgi:hypothetical protein